MRRRPSGLVATTTIAFVALLVASCSAPAAESETPRVSTVAPLNNSVPLPEAPPEQPTSAFDGLDARTRQAIGDAAEDGADISVVVLDRNTGQTVSGGDGSSFPIASVVKLFIADDLLLKVSKGETTLSPADRKSLDSMLRSSDDGAAQNFWDRLGGSAVIARVKARYGLGATTAPWNGHWDVTTSTAADLVRYYDMLLNGSGGLPPEQANLIMSDLAQSTPTGIDGYPQRFGIPEGLYAEPVAVKQGWFCCWNGGNQLHVTTGVIGSERRYVLAMGSLDPTGAAAARDRMTQVVKTMFPGGKI
ncbi:hypothetical protein DVS77_31110 [Mycolicibacterium moriokaense]|nr:hypothetical protein DVS77_31110 [Mycolicibacterium moriokaense]